MKFIKLLLIVIPVIAAGQQHQAPDRVVDVIHSKINIRVDIENEMVAGKVTHTVTPLRKGLTEFFFHAEDMDISDVRMEQRGKLNYELDSDKVWITLDYPLSYSDTIDVTLTYEAYPTRGVYFNRPDSAYPEKHAQAWTQGEDTDNHYWVPIYDYPNERATFEVILNVDKPYTGLSNGKLVNVSENANTSTWHWHETYPMVPYLISFVVGEYQKVEQNTREVPIAYWVYPEHSTEDAMRSFDRTPEMMAFFNTLTGYDYPFEKYDQVIIEDFMWGGMENITLTHQTDRTMHTENARPNHTSDGLVAHELAHSWYGDLITTRDWPNAWLNEGFATFLTYLWLEKDKGKEDGEYSRYKMIQSSIWTDNYKRRPTVEYDFTYSMELFNSNIYAKGAVILNMLRHYLGEDDFWRAVKQYTQDNQLANVETFDLKKAFVEITGQNLYWFFDQWLYNPGYPEYEVAYKYNRWSKELVLSVKQTQDLGSTSLFKMPVDILIDDGKIKRKQVWVESRDTSYVFPVSSKPEMVIFDEGFKILKKLEFQKTSKELKYQAVKAENILDRIWAVKELGKLKKNRDAINSLRDILNGYDHWAVKTEAAKAIGSSNPGNRDEILIQAFKNQTDERVKEEIIDNISDHESASFLEDAIFSEKNDYVRTAAVSSLIEAHPERVHELMDTLMTIYVHNDRLRRAAVAVYTSELNEDNYNTLKDLTTYGAAPWETRSAVFSQLSDYWELYDDVSEIIISHLEDPSYNVQSVCVSTLSSKGDESAIPHLKALMDSEKVFYEECSSAIISIQKRKKSSTKEDPEVSALKEKLLQIEEILNGK